MRVQLVSVPYRYDARDEGLGLGPTALLDNGLEDRLRDSGIDVVSPLVASLGEDDRVDGPVAVNIGKLGASTADLVVQAREAGDGVLVLAGDDTATVGVMSGLERAHGAGARIGLVWLDAHGDFNTPETSYSGILAGMPVAILAGLAGPLWRGSAGLAAPIPTDRIVVAGIRDLDEKEESLLRSTDVTLLMAGDVTSGTAFRESIQQLTANTDLIYLHIDLDVLDPSLVPSSSTPSRHGLTVLQAATLVRIVLATGKVAAVSVAGLNPGAGDRGRRSLRSTMDLILESVPAWHDDDSDVEIDDDDTES
jgi:arginase